MNPRLPGDPGAPPRVMGQDRPRLVVVDSLALTTSLAPFLSLRALASYSGLSLRRLRDLLRDPLHPLPHYRIGGKILVKRDEYDAWAHRYRQVGDAQVEAAVEDFLRRLR